MENPLANGYGIRTKYKVINAGSIDQLEAEVNDALNEGWYLQGGVSALGTYKWYIQALVREVMEEYHA